MKEILILLGIINTPLMIFWRIRTKKISKYSIYLEDKYYDLVTFLKSANEEQKCKLLESIEKSELYTNIKHNKGNSIDYFKDIM